MEEVKLDVQIRENKGRRYAKKDRRQSLIPAIIYGGKKEETTVKIDRRNFEHIRRVHVGENIIFRLNVFVGDKQLNDYTALIQEEQRHPVSDEILHVDFKRISLKEKIRVRVPLNPVGDAVGVVKDGGSLDHILWDLEVECFPMDIPKKIDVDVAALKIGDAVFIKDLKLPTAVVTYHDPEAIVFTVVPPMKEEVEKKPEEEITEPEVIKEKKEKEGEEGEEPKAKEAAGEKEKEKEKKEKEAA